MRVTRFLRGFGRNFVRRGRSVRVAAGTAILAGGMMFSGAARADVLFSENFDGLELKAVEEDPEGEVAQSLSRANENLFDGEPAWTEVPPVGWIRDNSRTPDASTVYPVSPEDADPRAPADSPRHTDFRPGGIEFYGFTFVNKEWWIATEGNQDRANWENGSETVMVADPDAYDDNGSFFLNPAGCQLCEEPGIFDVAMTTPPINLVGFNRNTVKLNMDSSFRPYDFMKALVDVSFDGGDFENVLTYDTDNSGGNSSLNRVNESLELALAVPSTARSMQVRFAMKDAGNDWWWAVDHIEVTADAMALACDLNGDNAADAADAGVMFGNWGNAGTGDCTNDGVVDAADAGVLFGEWTGDPQASAGQVAAEYNLATGEIKVSANNVVNWYVESASGALTGAAIGDLPGPGLVTDNNSRIGETALGSFTYDVSLGNVAATGLPAGDLTVYWNSALGTQLASAAVAYVPEPASIGMGLFTVGAAGLLSSRKRRPMIA